MTDASHFDPETQWQEWYDAIRKQVATTPPRCLADLVASPKGGTLQDNEWATWSLACTCGSANGAVLGYPLRTLNSDADSDNFVSPLAFQCAGCGRTGEIIDTGVHGYDGELAALEGKINAVNLRGSGERTVGPCPGCGSTGYAVTLALSYSDFDLVEDEPELQPRAQDFFMAFDCRCDCPSCGRTFGNGEL